MESNTQNQLDISNIQNHRFQNYLRNSNFDFSQRGSGLTPGPGGGPPFNGVTMVSDGWQVGSSTNTSYLVSRQAFVVGQTAVPNNPKYYMQANQNSFVSNGNLSIGQAIESVYSLAGKMVTFSFWAQTGVGTATPVVIAKQFFGTGGTPSTTNTFYTSSSFSVTAGNWQQYTFSFYVPTISGASLGTDGTDSLLIIIQFPFTLSAGQNFRIAQASLNEGSVAMPYRMMGTDISQELAICQRYYEKSYDLDTNPANITFVGSFYHGTTGDASGLHNFEIPYKVTKRIANHIVTIYRIQTGAGSQIDAYTTNLSAYTFNGPAVTTLVTIGQSGFKAYAFAYGAYAPGVVAGHYTADADYRNILL